MSTRIVIATLLIQKYIKYVSRVIRAIVWRLLVDAKRWIMHREQCRINSRERNQKRRQKTAAGIPTNITRKTTPFCAPGASPPPPCRSRSAGVPGTANDSTASIQPDIVNNARRNPQIFAEQADCYLAICWIAGTVSCFVISLNNCNSIIEFSTGIKQFKCATNWNNNSKYVTIDLIIYLGKHR